jgi:hypothetical protein
MEIRCERRPWRRSTAATSIAPAPSWVVLDSHTAAPGDHLCEDRVGVRGDLAWVIDGATPVAPSRLPDGASEAAWLASALDRELRAHASEPLPNLRALAAAVIAAVRDSAPPSWLTGTVLPPSAALALVRHHGDSVEYLVLADVSVHVGEHPPVTDLSAELLNGPAYYHFKQALARTGNLAEAQNTVAAELTEHRRSYMNQLGGYWVAALDPAAATHALHGHYPAPAGTRVLLCTDGFSRLWDTLGILNSTQEVMERSRTLVQFTEELRTAEEADAQCGMVARWKASDDVGALLLEV